MQRKSFLLLIYFVIVYSANLHAIERETDGITNIYPYNPMSYPNNSSPPNRDYYLTPNDNAGNLSNPNSVPEYKNSYPSPLDELINNKIDILFSQDSILTGTDIRASTNDGIVHLEGTVISQDQLNEAISVALSVDGVKSVKSTITITQTTEH